MIASQIPYVISILNSPQHLGNLICPHQLYHQNHLALRPNFPSSANLNSYLGPGRGCQPSHHCHIGPHTSTDNNHGIPDPYGEDWQHSLTNFMRRITTDHMGVECYPWDLTNYRPTSTHFDKYPNVGREKYENFERISLPHWNVTKTWSPLVQIIWEQWSHQSRPYQYLT